MANKIHEKTEIKVLKLSSVLTIAYAVAGIVIALACDSMTLLLDALYGMVDVVVSLIIVFAVRRIHQPPDEKYHYGYAKYEPLLQGLDGILVAAVCVAAIVTSIQDLFHPEPIEHLGAAVLYSFISIFICVGYGVYEKAAAKQTGSHVLRADSQLWIVEGLISFGVFVAFGIGLLISETAWSRYTDYVDPVLCIALSLTLLYKPVQIVSESLFDLVDRSPGASMDRQVREALGPAIAEFQLAGIERVRLRQAGRKMFVTVCLSVGRDEPLVRLEAIRQNAAAALKRSIPQSDVDVLFC